MNPGEIPKLGFHIYLCFLMSCDVCLFPVLAESLPQTYWLTALRCALTPPEVGRPQTKGSAGLCPPQASETRRLLRLPEATCVPCLGAAFFIIRARTVASSHFLLSALCSYPLLSPPPAFLLWGPCGHTGPLRVIRVSPHLQCEVWFGL